MELLRSDDNADPLEPRYNQSLFVRSMTGKFDNALWTSCVETILPESVLGLVESTMCILDSEQAVTIGHKHVDTTTWTIGDTTNSKFVSRF